MAGLETTPEMNDLRMSEGARPLFDKVKSLHPERCRSDHGRVLPARREPRGALVVGARPARAARRREGEGQGERALELLPARRRDRRGPLEPRLRLHRGRARQEPPRLRVPELLRARHRQHGSARARRHAGAEEAVARAAARRRDPLRLRDDRAGRRVVRRQEHRVPRAAATATSG